MADSRDPVGEDPRRPSSYPKTTPQPPQPPPIYARNPNEVEYGIDTRPEAQATSYYGGMADVSYFRPGPASPPERELRAQGPPTGESPVRQLAIRD